MNTQHMQICSFAFNGPDFSPLIPLIVQLSVTGISAAQLAGWLTATSHYNVYSAKCVLYTDQPANRPTESFAHSRGCNAIYLSLCTASLRELKNHTAENNGVHKRALVVLVLVLFERLSRQSRTAYTRASRVFSVPVRAHSHCIYSV